MRRWFSSSSARTLSGISSAIRPPPISKLPACIESKMRPRPDAPAPRRRSVEQTIQHLLGRRPAERLLTGTALDVFLHALARPVVRDLARRRLHEVRRRRHDRAAKTPVERELAAAYCVDD